MDEQNNQEPTAVEPQTQQTVQPTTNQPAKQHKTALGIIIAAILIMVAALVGIVLTVDNTNDSQNEQMSTSVQEVEDEDQDQKELSADYLGSYSIDETSYGTKVDVVVDETAGTRTIERNALPNHETGEFPNDGNPNTISAQDFSETYPLNPVFTGSATMARTVGIAINGVKFEPDTAERAVCDGTVQHSIEAIQNVTDLGLDFNNAHVQPTGEYHYHGVSDMLVDIYSTSDDLVHVGFAADGYLIAYSKSGAYSPSYQLGQDDREGTNCSYTVPGPNGGEVIEFGATKDGSLKSDWEYNASYGDLDECNGVEINGQYMYLLTDAYPYVGRCLMGEFSEDAPGGDAGPTGQDQMSGPPQGPPPGQGPPPQ